MQVALRGKRGTAQVERGMDWPGVGGSVPGAERVGAFEEDECGEVLALGEVEAAGDSGALVDGVVEVAWHGDVPGC
jgi:hypothetical protein